MLAWGLGDCREIRMNEQSEVLTAWASNEPKPMLAWGRPPGRDTIFQFSEVTAHHD